MVTLFQNILIASFHGSIVIGAVLALRLLLRKAPKKYLCYLWLLAGIRLLMPFQIQSELSLQPQSPPETLIRWEAPEPLPVFLTEGAEVIVQRPEIVSPGAAETAASSAAGVGLHWSKLVPVLWAGIAACFIIYSIFSYLRLRSLVRDAVKIPGGWESAGIDTAFILGFIKPRIYIPLGMAPTTRKHILAHERTHLDKGDHWIKMIGFLALALHWFNPLVWLAYILLCKDIEMACDERVVQFMDLPERKEYSTALLTCSSSRIHYAASPVAFGEVNVKDRIVSILSYRKPSFWLGLLSVTAIAFVTLCLVTSPTESPESISAPVPETVQPEANTTPPPAEPVSDWGFHMIADVHTATTMTLHYGVDVNGIPWDGTPIYKDPPYWIEHWDGIQWLELDKLVTSPDYRGSSGTEFSKDNIHRYYAEDELDWSLIYGELPEGYYRIGLIPVRNSQRERHYAQFRIWANDLTEKEAQAVSRCEAALDILSSSPYYSVSLQESNQQGELLPVRSLFRTNDSCRVDSYIGKICYNSFYCSPTEGVMQSWDDSFRLKENKRITFPEGEGWIRDDQIQFVTEWEDLDGVPYRQINTYSFAANGALTSANRLTSHPDEDGITVQSQRKLIVEKAGWGSMENKTQTPKDSHKASLESPWNIFFRVDDDYLAPTGGEIWFSASQTVGVVDYTTDGKFWLERKVNDQWYKVTPLSPEPQWADQTYRLSSRTTVIDWVDWSPYYGSLEPALYRMGKRFYNAEESIIQYAEFLIYPQGSIIGQGGEEAMLRVNHAIERIRNGNYHIRCEEGGSFRVPPEISTVFWKHDGICVTDYYDYQRANGYRHSALHTDPSDTLFYDYFLNYLYWSDPRYQIYFAQGASKISQEEILFAIAPTGSDRMYSLTYYSILFDKADNITQIKYWGSDFGTERQTILTVLDTPESEIAAWVQKIQAEQA